MTSKKPVNHLSAGIGNIFVSVGRRILDGKTGVLSEATSPLSVKTVTRYLLGVSLSKPTHVSNNDT